MWERLNYGGLVVAGIGFFLTRFTVTLAFEDTMQFYVAGVVPLVLGLGLSAFGMALAVASVDPSMVRTTAIWCLIGAGTMLLLVVLTLVGSSPDGMPDLAAVRSQTYLSNFLIGGSVGGTLTGLYASRNRRQQSELRHQRNRLVTLNRLLRHEILNAVTAIRGYANVDPSENPEGLTIIDDRAQGIQQTIEEVKYFTERSGVGRSSRAPRDLGDSLRESIETIEHAHPDASVSVDTIPDNLTVPANERLSAVFTHLLENAIVHGNDDTPTVDIESSPSTVTVTVTDEGEGLPESQQALLETGDIGEFDDPRAGFGLNIVRLLVENYGGTIETAVDPGGTTITVILPRVQTDSASGPNRAELTGVRPAVPHLLVTGIAAVLAGVVYGIASGLLGDSIAGIGIFYGTVDPVVGWLTHEFHSVVFGFIYVGLLSLVRERYQHIPRIYEVVGVVWGVVVWLVAASVIAPTWLRLLGTSAPIPNLSVQLLVTHLIWGLALGVFTAVGYEHVAPRLTDLSERLRGQD